MRVLLYPNSFKCASSTEGAQYLLIFFFPQLTPAVGFLFPFSFHFKPCYVAFGSDISSENMSPSPGVIATAAAVAAAETQFEEAQLPVKQEPLGSQNPLRWWSSGRGLSL